MIPQRYERQHMGGGVKTLLWSVCWGKLTQGLIEREVQYRTKYYLYTHLTKC